MSIPRSAVKHPITATMLFVALSVGGIISLTSIGMELFPDINLPTVLVYAVSPGVGPLDVEAKITKPLETSLAGLAGVQNIASESVENASITTIGFADGTDLDRVVPDVRERVNDAEDDFPEGTQKAMIFKYNPSILPSLRINVYASTAGIDIRRLVEEEVVPAVERVPGVARATVFGGRTSAVMVRVNLDSISKLEIPLTQILRVFQGENVSLPGGSIELQDRFLVLRTAGEFSSVDDIGYVLIGYRNNVPVFLRDVAQIALDFLPQTQFVRTDGVEGVRLAINKQAGYNTVSVNDGVLDKIEQLKTTLPPSIKFTIQENQATSVRSSIGGVTGAAWQGGLLAIFVLMLFLRNVRSTIIISSVIPLSIIATFSLVKLAGMTLNITSLLGITLAVGMFVDNAIVVLESIYRKQLQGLDPVEAAVAGTEEVAKAITASTLTTLAVFVPMLFVQGLAGLLFRDLSLTISFSLAVSLAAALVIIPVFCSKFLRLSNVRIAAGQTDGSNGHHELSLADVEVHTRSRIINRLTGAIQQGLRALDDGYERALSWCISHAPTVIISSVVLLVVSIGSILLLGMEFLPEADEGRFAMEIETRAGSPYRYTTDTVMQIEQVIRDIGGEDIYTMSSSVGDGGSNMARVSVVLVPKEQRTRRIWEYVKLVDEAIAKGVLDVRHSITIEGMSSLASSTSGEQSPIVIQVSGDDLEAMHAYALRIQDAARSTPGTRSVRIDYTVGKPEVRITVKRQEALSLGLSPLEVAATIRTAYNGSAVSRFRAGENDYDVQLILREQDRDSLQSLTSMFFVNPAGTKIPLENLATITEAKGPVAIRREGRVRVMSVLASLTGDRALSDVVDDMKRGIEGLGAAPPGIELTYKGAKSEMDSSFRSLLLALALAVMLVYMVMASQFESLVDPLLIMFSVPFAIIGLTGMLLITNTTFNLLAFVGAILLVGIVVNNGIVLIDFMETLRKRGVPLRDAIIQGGRTRLKPVLMTTLTTIFGMTPMAIGIGTGSELQLPLGRAVVGGLATSTLITLVLIPTIFWVVETKIRPRFSRMSVSGTSISRTSKERVHERVQSNT
jgi:HAE1 family hydrophobic/amphiphilic exporter-1